MKHIQVKKTLLQFSNDEDIEKAKATSFIASCCFLLPLVLMFSKHEYPTTVCILTSSSTGAALHYDHIENVDKTSFHALKHEIICVYDSS